MSPDSPRPVLPHDPLGRRRFLSGALRTAAAGALLPGLARLGGCAPEDPAEDGILVVDISALSAGERLVREDAEIPVEVIRTDAGVIARSLLCTHQGCVVHWVPEDRAYVCPCHDARFDEDGVPRFGPAQRPLRVLPVELRGASARIRLREPEA